jgi:23S rRNA (guanosine2251-2'-O)-methyltransferase
MLDLAQSRGIEIVTHSREALSRISKNRRQDQGVVLDIAAPNYQNVSVLNPAEHPCVIALENVTNPQNIGMAIRSIGASPAAGLILPRQGSAPLDALVIKASAGTLFKTPVFYCDSLPKAAPQLGALGYKIYGMTGGGARSLKDIPTTEPAIYVLGNETHGLSHELLALCDEQVKIPMRPGVESLNVSVAAALVAFRGVL